MAIHPTGRTQNVKASLYNYLQSNFTTTPIQFAGSAFDEQNKKEWVRADVIIESTEYFRQVTVAGLYGADLVVLMNMNVIIKADEVLIQNLYRREQIVDELRHIFRVPVAIPVFDHFASPTTDIGTLRTSEIEDTELGYNLEASFFQHNVSATLYFLSMWPGP